MKLMHFILCAFMSLLFVTSCDKDDDSCAHTYENGVKEIIDRSCAYAGCHAGAEASMWVPDNSKDYTNYDGILADLNSGVFTTRTLVEFTMPDTMWVPEGNPKFLTADELEILNCWKDNGFPQR